MKKEVKTVKILPYVYWMPLAAWGWLKAEEKIFHKSLKMSEIIE